jgi:hypothetical protein
MTWSEIKQAVKKAGVKDGDEIVAIRCEVRDGDGKLHALPQGEFVSLTEGVSDDARRDASGCAC